MKKAVIAVIAVAAVLVFIFTLTQKSEAATARDGYTLSRLISNTTDYYSSPIELTADLSGIINEIDLSANKKITSVPGSSFSLSINADHHNIFRLDGRKLMFQNLSLLTFSNATDSAIENKGSSLITFDTLTINFLSNSSGYEEDGGAIFNRDYSAVSFANSTGSFLGNSAEYGGAILNRDYSAVSFVKSRVNFLGNSSKADGGAILNSNYSTVSFVNSRVDFLSNKAMNRDGGAILNSNYSAVSFVNSRVNFLGNSSKAEGGAIFNAVRSTIIFKGGSKVIFENNTASKGADIYNSGTIEISEWSEVILRSGIDWTPTIDGVINIKSGGVLTISADEIGIGTLNVSAGSKFSLVDRQAIFATVYKTKTANIDNLTVAGILEIGIDLSANNINDQISAKSITFQKGSSLKIVPFNKWSSPKTYSIIFEGELRDFENLDYDRSRFVLNYDNKTKTLSLTVIKDPTL